MFPKTLTLILQDQSPCRPCWKNGKSWKNRNFQELSTLSDSVFTAERVTGIHHVHRVSGFGFVTFVLQESVWNFQLFLGYARSVKRGSQLVPFKLPWGSTKTAIHGMRVKLNVKDPMGSSILSGQIHSILLQNKHERKHG
jgi:hypothetical protein